ncbi:MAG TPA: translation initiation factor IF-3 [Streptosporangiaceae bacterium]
MVAPQASRAGSFCFHGTRPEVPGAGASRTRVKGDTGGHISTEPRINDRIRVPEVRLVGPSGEQVGIVSITDALRLAQEADLDLVEVAPTARPPVCKLMDFGKFKYESALKARESRKNQAQTVIKEIKIRPKIDPHDYGTKKGHVERFLKAGDKVKVTIMFRGREQSRPELGYKLLQRLAVDVEELGFVESAPKQDGRNMIMVIGPHRKKADARAVRGPDRASARASAPSAGRSAVALDEDELAQDIAAAVEAQAASAPPASPRAATSAPSASPRATSAPPASPRATSAPPASPRATSAPSASPRTTSAPSASPRPAAPGSATSSATAAPRPAAPRPAAPRPAAPRSSAPDSDAPDSDASDSAAQGSGAQGSTASTPKPGPEADGSARPAAQAAAEGSAAPKPAAPKPAAPKPGPPAGGTAKPAAPRPTAPRPTAPKPTAPRSSSAKPGEARAVPSPRTRSAEHGAADAGG